VLTAARQLQDPHVLVVAATRTSTSTAHQVFERFRGVADADLNEVVELRLGEVLARCLGLLWEQLGGD